MAAAGEAVCLLEIWEFEAGVGRRIPRAAHQSNAGFIRLPSLHFGQLHPRRLATTTYTQFLSTRAYRDEMHDTCLRCYLCSAGYGRVKGIGQPQLFTAYSSSLPVALRRT